MKLELKVLATTSDGKQMEWTFNDVRFWYWLRAKLGLNRQFAEKRRLLKSVTARGTRQEIKDHYPSGRVWDQHEGYLGGKP